MKSRANIKSHPLHPILVCFPIAFFTGTLIFDVLALVTRDRSFQNTGLMLCYAGILGAIAAAIPGVIDFVHTVPPKSSAKQRAAKHGILNSCMLLLFVVAVIWRQNNFDWIIVVIEFAGVIIMSIAGWLGGTLVHRNQIGVDVRYAEAGKWKEKRINTSKKIVEVATSDTLKINQMMLLIINNQRIVLARSENGYLAFEDRCTHKGASLAAGSMICGTVQCPWHGSQFNCSTGVVTAGPAKNSIRIYKIEENNNLVSVVLD